MTRTEAQSIARRASNLPYAYQIEMGQLFLDWDVLETIASKFGDAKAREIVAASTVCDKGVII